MLPSSDLFMVDSLPLKWKDYMTWDLNVVIAKMKVIKWYSRLKTLIKLLNILIAAAFFD
jgi:hypothetical protein